MSWKNEGRPYSKGSDPAAARAAKEERVARAVGRQQRANLRFRTAVLLEEEILRRQAAQDVALSRRTAQDFLLRQYLNAGPDSFLKRLNKPAVTTTWRLLREVERLMEDGPLQEADFMDAERTGRPARDFAEPVTDFLTRLIVARPKASIRYLQAEVRDYCEAKHHTPVPNLYDVRRFKMSFDNAELSAAAHGSRAAVTDALPKSTVLTDFPHQAWTLDELDAPVFVKGFDRLQNRMVSAKPKVVVIVDNHSRVIVNYWVPDPFGTSGIIGSYTADDITGTFMGAVLPELAAPACRDFAGYVPRSLRLDCHGTHEALRDLGAKHHFDVPDLPGETPHHRGMVERLVGTLKKRCEGLHGYDEFYQSADQVMAEPKSARTRGAGRANDRVTRKTLIAPDDLLDITQFRKEFDAVVAKYHDDLHASLGTTPRAEYLTKLQPKRVRSGYDALCWIKPVSLKYGAQGVRHLGVRFVLPFPRGTIPLGSVLVCYPDRLMRGLYAEVAGRQGTKTRVFLVRVEEAARAVNPETLARGRNSTARAASDNAAAIHVDLLEEKVGTGAVARANAVLDTRLKERKGLGAERRKARQERDIQGSVARAAAERALAETPAQKPARAMTADTLSGTAAKAVRTAAKGRSAPESADPTPKRSASPGLKNGSTKRQRVAPPTVNDEAPDISLVEDEDDELPFGMLTSFTARLRKADGSK